MNLQIDTHQDEWVVMQQGAGGGFGTKSGSVESKKMSLNVAGNRGKRQTAGKSVQKDVRFKEFDQQQAGKVKTAIMQKRGLTGGASVSQTQQRAANQSKIADFKRTQMFKRRIAAAEAGRAGSGFNSFSNRAGEVTKAAKATQARTAKGLATKAANKAKREAAKAASAKKKAG